MVKEKTRIFHQSNRTTFLLNRTYIKTYVRELGSKTYVWELSSRTYVFEITNINKNVRTIDLFLAKI